MRVVPVPGRSGKFGNPVSIDTILYFALHKILARCPIAGTGGAVHGKTT